MSGTMRKRSEKLQLNFGLIIAVRKTDTIMPFDCSAARHGVHVMSRVSHSNGSFRADMAGKRITHADSVELLNEIKSNGMGFSLTKVECRP